MIMNLLVAVPINFDIEYHLTLRELANIPDNEKIPYFGGLIKLDSYDYKMDVDVLRAMASSIATSKVTTLMNRRPDMFIKMSEILNDLGLIIHIKVDHEACVFTQRRDSSEGNRRILFVCTNVLRIIEGEEWSNTLQRVVELEDYYPPEEVMQQLKN